jgi:hypothetical protein
VIKTAVLLTSLLGASISILGKTPIEIKFINAPLGNSKAYWIF